MAIRPILKTLFELEDAVGSFDLESAADFISPDKRQSPNDHLLYEIEGRLDMLIHKAVVKEQKLKEPPSPPPLPLKKK